MKILSLAAQDLSVPISFDMFSVPERILSSSTTTSLLMREI
jgi:hypothetical protein